MFRQHSRQHSRHIQKVASPNLQLFTTHPNQRGTEVPRVGQPIHPNQQEIEAPRVGQPILTCPACRAEISHINIHCLPTPSTDATATPPVEVVEVVEVAEGIEVVEVQDEDDGSVTMVSPTPSRRASPTRESTPTTDSREVENLITFSPAQSRCPLLANNDHSTPEEPEIALSDAVSEALGEWATTLKRAARIWIDHDGHMPTTEWEIKEVERANLIPFDNLEKFMEVGRYTTPFERAMRSIALTHYCRRSVPDMAWKDTTPDE